MHDVSIKIYVYGEHKIPRMTHLSSCIYLEIIIIINVYGNFKLSYFNRIHNLPIVIMMRLIDILDYNLSFDGPFIQINFTHILIAYCKTETCGTQIDWSPELRFK